ncbi:rod shape-determining protein MreD [Desulfonispora thiosulfatigenes DSM 11270]|uniref:Rod shape-determining protein MreD n=1 Tax=Desulfonispora thiosulfatigenes DSM 11270 TaxID=656914 RepID=A0A1W1VG02_DESTI|nr:rod shape-determining protein MreD [Desulfonispora thiosulfatigenes]SMB92160.1 rod shape-determining protein MreD [Desulfonispora thiosulfatigenes DSM 11270]
MKVAILFLVAFISLILESTVFNEFTLLKIKPDLLLIYVSLFALQKGSKKGASFGFGIGLLEDLFMAKFIGMNALVKAIVGFGIGFLEKRIYKENFLVPIIMVMVGTIIAGFGFYILSLILGIPISINHFKVIVLPMLLYNILLTPIIKFVFFKTNIRRY